MEHSVGTLVITRHPVAAGFQYRVYTVVFLPGDRNVPFYGVRRCSGDDSLLRLLEDLLPGADVRLRALEQMREHGHAALSDVTIPNPLLTKHGLSTFRDVPARQEGSGTTRLCAVCRQPVAPHDRLTMLDEDVVHHRCRPESGDVVEATARLLASVDQRMFCHTCLARLMRIDMEDVRKTVSVLRARSGFRLKTGRCAGCGRLRMTLGGTRDPSQA